ncbi:hypothetical protein [Pseudoruegeria sp. HB172150]|uniref:hypothetical protein n=1 Tax=Pseudoruegeria sp. HB172150 TaxID=2721164 RepID=UPI0015536EF7|nr:hypothetical protein [Pseudoruegeria sp. HB172150]
MRGDVSGIIASLLGPILVVLSASEALNLGIWTEADPTLVYLNGLILFAVGLGVVRFHNIWQLNWRGLVTLAGWLLLAAGAYRMFFPTAPQMSEGPVTYALIAFNFLVGAILSYQAYRRS